VSSARSRIGFAFDQPLTQAAPQPQPPLQTPHLAVIVFVIIAKEMEEAMEREDPELRANRMAGRDCLPGGNTMCNHDIAELTRLIGGERQHVRG
jgi:hypothetical protein